ncbi:MAG TPA: ATP synthase F1 subunit delta [Lachnospiraceae bacterium]|jgi:F-type H+-transporting ATPase subunit delta|nr:ATP synthase F1 subunit delta [Lachnospiraceae bacterium]
MAKLISKTYGEALYELAIERDMVDTMLEEVSGLITILSENTDFTKLMNHPKIVREEKEEIMERVFKGRISDELTGFLKIIISNGRYGEVLPALQYYVARVKELKNIGIAYVTTAMELSSEQKAEVEKRLIDTTKYVKMEMNYIVDTAIIGGMIIRIGDRVVDSSIRTKLYELSKDLLQIQLG